MTIRPGLTPCLNCLVDSGCSGGQGLEETCDTVGVLGPVVNLVASLQAGEALKLLAGREDALHGSLISFDIWSGHLQSIRVARNPGCRTCVKREFSHLEGETQPHIPMCAPDSVQIHQRSRALVLQTLTARLEPVVSEVRQNDFLLRFHVATYEMTVFADGRAILKGTKDPSVARSLYARYIGA